MRPNGQMDGCWPEISSKRPGRKGITDYGSTVDFSVRLPSTRSRGRSRGGACNPGPRIRFQLVERIVISKCDGNVLAVGWPKSCRAVCEYVRTMSARPLVISGNIRANGYFPLHFFPRSRTVKRVSKRSRIARPIAVAFRGDLILHRTAAEPKAEETMCGLTLTKTFGTGSCLLAQESGTCPQTSRRSTIPGLWVNSLWSVR